MSFFNPLDVITGGAHALPGTGVSQAAINAGKVGAVGQGSLATLGGGPQGPPILDDSNRPQPGNGLPLLQQPPIGQMNPDLLKRYWDPNFDPRLELGFHDPKVPGGSGQPIGPQPVPGMPPQWFDPNIPIAKSGANPNAPFPDPGTWGHITTDQGMPGGENGRGPGGAFYQPPMFNKDNGQGTLQSLGGGQLNQSGMVNLRGPDGTTKAVPQLDLAHWLSKGAVQVS